MLGKIDFFKITFFYKKYIFHVVFLLDQKAGKIPLCKDLLPCTGRFLRFLCTLYADLNKVDCIFMNEHKSFVDLR